MRSATVTEVRRQRMPDLLIRGLDEDIYYRLRNQAKRNGVSMQVEATGIIAAGVKPTIQQWVEEVREYHRTHDSSHIKMTTQDIVDLIHEGREERSRRIETAAFGHPLDEVEEER